MANRLILGSALSLALLMFPQMALSTAPKLAVKKNSAAGKAARKSKPGKIYKSTIHVKRKTRARSSTSSASYRASSEIPHSTPLKRVVPQRNGHFIVEPYKSRKKLSHVTGPAAKLTCAEVIPGSLWRDRALELPNFRDLILTRAKTYQGTPYVLGASLGTDSATDCSGFVQFIYQGFRIDLPRTSAEQAQVGKIVTHRLDFSKMLPGDLLFFRRGSRFIGHAGIYLGEGKMIHASNHRRGVVITDLRQPYYLDSFVVAKRVFEMAYPEW